MKKLFLHVGTHKTGTTSIQDFCAINSEQLLQNGLWYPNFERGKPTNSHHDFFKALVYGTNRLHGKCNEIANYWYNESESLNADVFVSAEPIYRLISKSGSSYNERQIKFLSDVKAVLSKFEVIPVVVYREHSKFIESLYSEQVANGNVDGFFDLLDYASSQIRPLLNYSGFLENLIKVFGEKTICLKFEDLFANGTLVSNFFERIGYQQQVFRTNVNSRKSLSIPSTRLKECVNPTLRSHKKSKNKKVLDYLKSNQSDIDVLIEKTLYAADGYQLWASEQRKSQFIESIQPDVNKLTSFVDFSMWQHSNFNYNSVFLPPYNLLKLNSSLLEVKKRIFQLV